MLIIHGIGQNKWGLFLGTYWAWDTLYALQ